MQNGTTGSLPSASNALLAKVTWLTLAAGSVLCAAWLWSCWCSFPSIPWNDIRVAPAVALLRGISIYAPEGSGPVSTWVYGPLPLLLLSPAGFASSAAGAIEVAGAIHIGLTVSAIALTAAFWPGSSAPVPATMDRQRRLGAVLLAVLAVRNESSGYVVYSADAPGLAFGLFSLLALAHRRLWPAAFCAAAAVACKQTLLGVVAAQVLWVAVVMSPRAAILQVGRCAAAGAAVALPAIAYFGFSSLWYTMVELPGRFPWATVAERFQAHAGFIGGHLILPLAVIGVWWRVFFGRNSPALLPTLAFVCVLPFSLLGFLKIGGNINSLHSFWLWFPPALVAVVTAPPFVRLGQAGCLAIALLGAAVASLWLQVSFVRVRPNIEAYRQAAALTAQFPEKIWFPMSPLVTLYSDGRFYHDYDGLNERLLAGQRLSPEHFFAHMPRNRRFVATLLPIGWGPADPGEARMPPNSSVRTFGVWRLDVFPP